MAEITKKSGRGGARPNTGGARPGAGRPRKNPQGIAGSGLAPTPAEIAKVLADKAKAGVLPPHLAEVEAVLRVLEATVPQAVTREPLEFLLDVMQGKFRPTAAQLQAATTAAQYLHSKKDAPGGKKPAAQETAKTATAPGNKFAPRMPPHLAIAK